MKEVRLNLTDNEKIAQNVLGLNSDYSTFNMKEKDINNLIAKEKERKFNNEFEAAQEKLMEDENRIKKDQESMDFDISQAEIKPMFNRVLVKPFKHNPFQPIVRDGSIITETNGYIPQVGKNPITGKNEELAEDVITGCVVEIGPDVKYIEVGDTIYYRKPTSITVPFFKQGFYSVAESQIIATVNVGLTDRFNKINDNGR